MKSKRYRTGIRFRLILGTVAIVGMGFIILSVLTSRQAGNELKYLLKNKLDAHCKGTASRIDEWIKNRFLDAQHWTKQEQVIGVYETPGKESDARAGRFFKQVVSSYPYYQSANLLDSKGHVVASNFPDKIRNLYLGDRLYFQKAIKGEIAISSVLISRATFKAFFTIAAPVKSPDNKKIYGVLYSPIDLEKFTSEMIEPLETDYIGTPFLIDSKGRILYHKNQEFILKSSDNILSEKSLKKILSSSSGIIRDSKNQEKLLGYTKIPTTGWYIIIFKSSSDAFSKANYLRKFIIFIGLIILLIVAFGLIILINPVVTGIIEVSENLEKISRDGSLDVHLKTKDQTEIGELVTYFNNFIDKLKEHITFMISSYFETRDQILRTYSDSVTGIDQREDIDLKTERFKKSRLKFEKEFRKNLRLSYIDRQIRIMIEEFKKVDEAWKDSEERFHVIFSQSSEMMFIIDSTLSLCDSNKVAIDYFTKQINSGPDEIHKKIKDFMKSLVEQHHESGTARIEISFAFQGQIREISFYISEVGSSTGQHYYFITGHDITELKEAERRAQEASRAKSEFLANMSHEIRTPMNAISGFSELLSRSDLNSGQKDYLRNIRSASNSLLHIINEILDFSKIESGKMTIDIVPFRIESVISNLMAISSVRAREKGLQMDTDISCSSTLLFQGDPYRLHQVLLNLINNSIKFTSSGFIHVGVDIKRNLSSSAQVKFTVKDSGIGIKPEKLESLFSPFVQADSSITRKYGGTGLGLAISSQLVELMGGKLSVESTFGEGTTFYFTIELPIQEEPFSLHPDFAELSTAVIDENEKCLISMSSMLSRMGITVENFKNPESYINTVKKGTEFDIIFISNTIPDFGLSTVVSFIKNNSSKTHLIMLKNWLSESTGTETEKESDFDNILEKPVDSSDLYNTIVNIVDYNGVVYKPEKPRLQSLKSRSFYKNSKVLLVEDNEINTALAKALLKEFGIDPDCAETGVAAVQLATSTEYDLILMDLQMPEMDGYTAAFEIRRMGIGVPIVALTANAVKEDLERALESGMNDYLTKPLILYKFHSVLAKYLGKVDDNSIILTTELTESRKKLPLFVEGIDSQQLLDNLSGNVELFNDLLMLYYKKYNKVYSEINAFIEDNNTQELRPILHDLSGVTGNICANNVMGAIRRLQESIHQNASSEEIRERANHASVELQNLTTSIEKYLKTLI
ncbi:response regulator [Myxococcota bacterium]|nr:response regulator [Myxococcota bacterium]MBU1380808.1 response regulator [Myxococcota bacterium]MBU1498942.1 response regulator [Myxococcota bacterium]